VSRITATDRLQRILAVLPWIVQHQGATVDEICERFALDRKALLADLDFVFYNVGLHPFTPDMLAEVSIVDDRVYVHVGDYFRRPLRLAHGEALTLLAAGRAVVSRPGADPDGTLRRAVDKLADALGEGAAQSVDVALGTADPEVMAGLQEALSRQRRISMSYYSYGRDASTEREVDPQRLLSTEGRWYLLGHCRSAEGERMFRVDRIRSVEVLDEPAEVVVGDQSAAVPGPWGGERTVQLITGAEAHWVSDTYPCDEVQELPDGRLRIVLPVTTTRWLERLLLRLDPSTEVTDVASGDSLREVASDAARRVLARYER
jgi:proteasome accessory factor C